jgi:hypothetical protein
MDYKGAAATCLRFGGQVRQRTVAFHHAVQHPGIMKYGRRSTVRTRVKITNFAAVARIERPSLWRRGVAALQRLWRRGTGSLGGGL